MWGPGSWGMPMWGMWWIFPLVGLFIFLLCAVAMIRFMSEGRRFMCMGGDDHDRAKDLTELSRKLDELREEVRQLKTTR